MKPMERTAEEAHRELGRLEITATPKVPAVSGRLFDGKLFLEFMKKDGDLFLHIFKPVEAAIRKAESEIRARCPALYPTSENAAERRLQLYLRAEQERCDARRMAWREDVVWPDIGDLIKEAIDTLKFSTFDNKLEFVEEMDGWNITFYKAEDIPEEKVDDLINEIVDRFSDLKFKWPRERFQ
jgi:hypothetical protein